MVSRKPVLGNAPHLLLLGALMAAAPLLASCASAPYQPVATSIECVDDGEFTQRLFIRNVPPLTCLEDVDAVNSELFNMRVVDAAGYHVGHFRRVETKGPGDLVAVITLDPSRRTIGMLSDHLRYEPTTRTIIADLTNQEIDLIPPDFPGSRVAPYG
jgi:hypothetical protein